MWEPGSGILFSGDAVYDGPLLDEIPGSDIQDHLVTMERLSKLPVTVVHAGHDPSMSPERCRAVIAEYVSRRTVEHA